MDELAGGVGELGRAVGPWFGAAFLAIVVVWVQFLVRWRDEKRELGLSAEGLARLLDALERPGGALHAALADRFRGRPCAAFPGRGAFEAWFAEHIAGPRAAQAGALFQGYLWGVLATVRDRLRAADNRVDLAAVRNELRRYRYHRWLNFGLANTAVSLGVLGTVTGLWAGFDRIDFGGGDIPAVMEEVMGAMSRALYTTAVGVLVSIPIVITGLAMERQLEEIFGMAHEVRNALAATLRQFAGDGAAAGAAPGGGAPDG